MIEYDEDEPISALARAENELKRVDHLIYVSLKYTRTVDVIKNIINRLINCFDFVIDDLLHQLEEKGDIYDVPSAPGLKMRLVKEHYLKSHAQLQDYLDFYILLKQLDKAEYKALREFRRHVTMVAELPNGEMKEINIDVITEFYAKTKEFMKYAKTELFIEAKQ